MLDLRAQASNIIDKLTRFQLPKPEAADVKTVLSTARDKAKAGGGFQRDVPKQFEEFDRDALKQDRRSKLKEIHDMLGVDPRIDRYLSKLVSDASHKGCTVVVESADSDPDIENAQAVIDRTLKNINIQKNLQGWTKGLLRDGDLFLQLVVDAKESEVVRAKKLAAEMTFTRMNAEGNYPKDKLPYYQESRLLYGEVLREFEEWEVVHARWDYEDGKPYGKQLFAAARLSWRRLDSGEENITIRRAIRAGLRLHHKIGSDSQSGTLEDIQQYRDQNEDTLENPTNPVGDFFTNEAVDIATIGGDGDIGELADLKYLEGLLSIICGIPSALVSGGREASTNQNVVKEQEEDYNKVVANINSAMEDAIREIIDLALLLKTINPDSIIYTLKWGSGDRDDLTKKIEQADKLQVLGYSFRTLFDFINLDGVKYEDEMERIREQTADGIVPYGINTRVDPTLAALISGNFTPPEDGGGESDDDVDDELEELRKMASYILQGVDRQSNGNGRHTLP